MWKENKHRFWIDGSENRKFRFLFFSSFVFFIFQCSVFAMGTETSATSATQEKLASANNAFALDLFHQLNKTSNLVFSPYSISTALAMAWTGARNNTATQMAQVLHFQDNQNKIIREFHQLQLRLEDIGKKGDVELNVANSLWINKNFRFSDSFLSEVQKTFDAELNELDFSNSTTASQAINQWVEQKTDGKIKDLLSQNCLSSKIKMVLVNAVYFFGNWDKQFETNQTRPRPFYLQGGNPVTIKMMQQKNLFPMFENDDIQILELPYKGQKLSMILVLPKKKDGLPTLEQNLTLEKLQTWLSNIKKREVIVMMPKFKFEFGSINLVPNLQSLGMTDVFNSDKADLTGMLAKGNKGSIKSWIGFVFHKAFIDVDEKGTEAAAATGVGVMGVDVMLETPVFNANHPFIFLILDNHNKNILFMGRMADPNFCQK